MLQSGVILFAGELIVTIPRESVGESGSVWDIAVCNRDRVFLACGDDGGDTQ